MSFSGYDIEDAIIMNKAAIDRGFGRSSVSTKYSTSLKKYANGLADRTIIPPDDTTGPNTKFSKLDKDGICHIGSMIN